MNKPLLRTFFLLLLTAVSFQRSFAVTAGFTIDHASGCAPLVVHFTNTSTGATSYTWDFGNTNGSFFPSPTTSYFDAGTYTVTLTAFNGPASSVATAVITVYPLPTVNFTADDTTLCPGANVHFTSTTTGGTPGWVSNTWYFGDGNSDTGATVPHGYGAAGYYTVTLFSTNSMGCVKSLSKTSYIRQLTNPIPGFSSPNPYPCSAPATVTFTNSSTGSAPLSYLWRFGDGPTSTSTLTAPTHPYASLGTYDVFLKVTDVFGCTDSVTQVHFVDIGSPTATFTAADVCTNSFCNFHNTSSPHATASWDFGDGSGISTEEAPVHTFSSPGTYNVKLTVSNIGCSDTEVHSIVVWPLPVVTTALTPLHPCPPAITGSFTTTLAPGSSADWLLPNGTHATGASVPFTFIFNYIFNTQVTVTDINGCVATRARRDTIYNFGTPVTASPSSGCVPLTVTLNVTPTGAYLDTSVIPFETHNVTYPFGLSSYDWDFGDGTPNSSSPSPVHIYTAAGTYTVTFTAVSNNGCTKSGTKVITVGVAPLASFSASTTHSCAGKYITLTGTVTPSATSYKWEYGDFTGDSGTAFLSSTHFYAAPGTRTVTFTAYKNGCKSNIDTEIIYIDSPKSIAVYSYLCIPPNGIAFTDASVGATSRMWLFGDGDTSSLANPVHYYPTLSPFSAKLATYSSVTGCRDTFNFGFNLARPVVNFTAKKTQLCLGALDTFTSSTAPLGAAVAYKWYDNNVLFDSVQNPVYSFTTPGLHTIRLIIKDTHLCFDTLTRVNYVKVPNPIDTFYATTTTGCGPFTVSFTDLSTDIPTVPITNYFWAFGDGDTISASFPAMVHTYSAAGTYDVQSTITDAVGCVNTRVRTGYITVYRPSPAFTAPTSGCKGRPVHFTNTSTSATGAFWMFGDGATSSDLSPDHVYTATGTYTIKLVAIEAHGCTDTLTRTNYITINPSPVASFTMSDSTAVCPPLNVAFTNTSTGYSSSYWSFGDGLTSTAPSPGNPYIASGLYDVFLSVQNTYGCTDTARGHVNIFGYSGSFSYTPHMGCSPLEVTFSAPLAASAASVIWDFSDGSTLSGAISGDASHVYTTPGAYVPKLILTDGSGCTNSSVGTDTIKVDDVTNGFTITPPSACENNSITFHETASGYFAPIVARDWTLETGVTSTLSTVAHSYSLAGTYPVKLIVTDGWGCRDTLVQDVTVNPIPDAITGTAVVCVGLSSTLASTSLAGTWAVSNPAKASISSDGIITGVAAGTATVTYTLPTGCFNTRTITVNPLPASVTGIKEFCEASVTTLSDASTGGTWSSANALVGSVDTATGIVYGAGDGVTLITYTLPTSCYITTAITVDPLPDPISGVPVLCEGYTTTLSDASAGGTWSITPSGVATISSGGVVSGLLLGTTIVTYTLPTTCRITQVVTVYLSPGPISGVSSICAGDTAMFTNTVTGGTWTTSAPGTASIDTFTGKLTAISAGAATVTYWLGSGCSVTKNIVVNPLPDPITGTTTVCETFTTTLSDAAIGGAWSSSTTSVATINIDGIMTGIAAGTTTITYTLPTTCYITASANVNPVPYDITGTPAVCVGSMITLGETWPGGTWSSTVPLVGPIDTAGHIIGLSEGNSNISYTLPTGCYKTVEFTVNPLPASISGYTTVCIDAHITLSDATMGGTWTSDNASIASIDLNSGVVTGISAGVTYITYTLSATGCYVTFELTVNPLPPPIGGDLTVCAGFATNLTNGYPGGTWSADLSLWGTGHIHPMTGVVTAESGGTLPVTYTIMTGCMMTAIVTVNNLPEPIGGIAAVCVGSTTSLDDITWGGTWISDNPLIASVDFITGVVSGNAAGTTMVSYILFTTGCPNRIEVTVNPLPSAISGTMTVCEGSITHLTDPVPSGTWSSSSTAIATVGATSGIVTGMHYGTVRITYTLPTGCNTSTVVTVHPTPPAILGSPGVCFGSTTTLANALGGGHWTSSNTAVATIGSLSGIVTSVSVGSSLISYTSDMGCLRTIVVTVHPLPAAYTVTGGGTYCTGGTGVHVSLSGSNTGISYALYYGSSATGFVAGTGTPLDFGLLTMAGVYTVEATNIVTGCKKPMIGHADVIIAPLITPSVTITIAGGDSVCSGAHAVCTPAPVFGGAAPTYVWKVNGFIVSTASSYTFTPADGDTISVRMHSDSACASPVFVNSSKIIRVLPNATPNVWVTADPPGNICEFSPVTYTANSMYGGTAPAYTWLVNSTTSGTGPVFSYVPNNGDIVACKLTSNYQCRLATNVFSANIPMTVDPLVVPHVEVVEAGGYWIGADFRDSLYTIVTDAGLSPHYRWYINSIPVPGAIGPTLATFFHNNDSVSCQVVSGGVCHDIGSHDWKFISVPPVFVGSVAGNGNIILVPNPNKGIFTLSGDTGLPDDELMIEVANMLGQVVYSKRTTPVRGHIEEHIALEGALANGMYLLTLRAPSGNQTFHFVIDQ